MTGYTCSIEFTNVLHRNNIFSVDRLLPLQFLCVDRTFTSGIADHSKSLTTCTVRDLRALQAKGDWNYPTLPITAKLQGYSYTHGKSRPVCNINTPSLFFALAFGVSSTNSVSSGIFSGRMKYLMLFPRRLNVSRVTVALSLIVIFTDFKCVFILMSTPATMVEWVSIRTPVARGGHQLKYKRL